MNIKKKKQNIVIISEKDYNEYYRDDDMFYFKPHFVIIYPEICFISNLVPRLVRGQHWFSSKILQTLGSVEDKILLEVSMVNYRE